MYLLNVTENKIHGRRRHKRLNVSRRNRKNQRVKIVIHSFGRFFFVLFFKKITFCTIIVLSINKNQNCIDEHVPMIFDTYIIFIYIFFLPENYQACKHTKTKNRVSKFENNGFFQSLLHEYRCRIIIKTKTKTKKVLHFASYLIQ